MSALDPEFSTDVDELKLLRALTRCKFFLLNPRYPAEQPMTYLPCCRLTGHSGPCRAGEP